MKGLMTHDMNLEDGLEVYMSQIILLILMNLLLIIFLDIDVYLIGGVILVAIGPKDKPKTYYPEVAIIEKKTIIIKPYLIDTENKSII